MKIVDMILREQESMQTRSSCHRVFCGSTQVINIVSAKIFPTNSQLRFENQLIVITLMRFLSIPIDR
jgi:hypothetical protein